MTYTNLWVWITEDDTNYYVRCLYYNRKSDTYTVVFADGRLKMVSASEVKLEVGEMDEDTGSHPSSLIAKGA